MMPSAFELGKRGEDLACSYLVTNGYEILRRNWFWDHKEIDIIAKYANEIVIVEVKTRESNYFGEPWEAISIKKIRNLVDSAEAWLIQENIDLETRFDVITIVFTDEMNYILQHYPNAFIPPVN